MKKILIIVISIFLFIPSIKNADSVNYTIENYYIDADIRENGDLEVTELIVLKGSFNGYIRDIVYKNNSLGNSGYANNKIYNASDIELIDISAKNVKNVSFETINDQDYKSLKVNQASNLGYLENDIVNGKSYKMYYKSNHDKVAFKLKYIVKDVVVLHNDVAEVYWMFIGKEYDDKINDLKIKVNLPKYDDSKSFRVWAHGELSGEIKMHDNSYIMASVSFINAYEPVDIRTTFDKSLVNEFLIAKKSNDNALDNIIEVENLRADEANQKRKQMKVIYNTFKFGSIIYFGALIVAWILVYLKYDKEYKSTYKNEYNREFIDEYNVEVVDYLMNKNITPNALSASIMNLIYKKVIKVEEIPTTKNKKDYKFILIDETNVNETEKYLIDFLFNKVGKDNSFTSKELHNYAKNTTTCEKFGKSYTTWKNKVINDGIKENFFEKKGKSYAISGLFFLVAIIIVILALVFNVVMPFVFINLIFSLIFLLYTFAFFKRTKKGNEDFAKWKAFKKFLNDFGRFDLKELPEVILWERYMVYATIFGLASKVSKCMNVKIKELEESGIYVGGYYPSFNDFYVFNSLNHVFTNAINSNSTAITEKRANSISSSGSGFGGGFSGGSGFGGGGGGGRGF